MESDFPREPDEPTKRQPAASAPPEPAADWLGWSMQFVFGFVVGWLGGHLFTEEGRRSIPLITSDNAPAFCAGVGLITAAFASHYGDQMWLGSSYRVIPPDAPQQNRASLVASIIAGTVGGLLVAAALARTFGLLL